MVDLFISAKIRKHNKASFGFVRYGSSAEAERAITEFNEFRLQGKQIRVSMAKYEKDGTPVSLVSKTKTTTDFKKHKISTPAFRNERKYAEVVAGAPKQRQEQKMAEDDGVIPVTHSLKVTDNVQTAGMLHSAIIAENSEVFLLPQTLSRITEAKVNETGIYSLSPTKLLFTFRCEINAKKCRDYG